MKVSFNLIDQPWIPCVLPDGISKEYGLLDTLCQAHNIREIHDASPLVTVALHRLLLAILHRNFGPESPSAWRELWETGSFDSDILREYLQKWYSRFDLFDEERPFYQSSRISKRITIQPISKLFHEASSGNNATLFDHTFDDGNMQVAFNKIARGVIALQAYALSGIESGDSEDGKSHPSAAPMVRGAVNLVSYKTLFATLVLNLIRYSPEHDRPFVCIGKDYPSWEQDEESLWQQREPRGYLDYLTWQSRQIKLVCDDSGTNVINVLVTEGVNYPKASALCDPYMGHSKNENKGKDQPPWLALKFRPSRALWRDSVSLFKSLQDSSRPAILDWVNQLARFPGVPSRVALDSFGIANYQKAGKINFWRHERLPMPLRYLQDDFLVNALEKCLRRSEEIGDKVQKSLWTLAHEVLLPGKETKDLSKGDKDAIRKKQSTYLAANIYWSSLELPFMEMIERLPDAPDLEAEVALWFELSASNAKSALKQTVNGLKPSSRNLKASVKAHSKLAYEINKLTGGENDE